MTPLPHDPRLASPGVGRVDPAQPARRPDPASTPPRGPQKAGRPSFADVLRQETSPVKFTKHALQRVERRGIDLDANDTRARLEAGVERAQSKGARDSVVFVDGTAFVVSVRNRTVITAVDSEHMREHVFTNIDSAVIA